MQHPGTDITFPSPWQDREKQNESVHVPLMIGIGVFRNHGILVSEGNLISLVHASGNGNMSSALTG